MGLSFVAPLAGRDDGITGQVTADKVFQSTRPLRGATFVKCIVAVIVSINFNPRAPCGARRAERPWSPPSLANFNPRAPCGARPSSADAIVTINEISIHAPLAGRDACDVVSDWLRELISIHAPLAGRDVCTRQGQRRPRLFQSTRHSRRKSSAADFNPRAPCGARQRLRRERLLRCVISIHAPLAGRDTDDHCVDDIRDISIHAPLAGRDGR